MAAEKKARKAKISRKTKETQISVEINIDGRGDSRLKTPVGFLDHMLELLAMHGGFDLKVSASGDTHIDAHHLVEDLGICMGQAFFEALGDRKGIKRYGHMVLPMDEALADVAVDISGRPLLVYKVEIPERRRWDFDLNLIEEFMRGFANAARLTLHARLLYGSNWHHCVEAVFKAFARALREAVTKQGARRVMSTKGKLD
jgi:imidazoleglycerol-phosphate dehydratase